MTMTNEEFIRALRDELGALRARYDGDVPPEVYDVVKELETAISWHVYKGGRTPTIVRTAKEVLK
jgi:hypothetical protein